MSLRTYRLSWPREIKADEIAAALRALATTAGTPLVLDSLGQHGHVEHRLHVLDSRSGAVVDQLRSAIAGIGVEHVENPAELPQFGLAVSLGLSTRRRPLAGNQNELTSRGLLVALAGIGREEAILLRWVLTDRLQPQPVPSTAGNLQPESIAKALLIAPFRTPPTSDADTRSALRDKQAMPGWRAIGKVAVAAASNTRRRQLAATVLGALRTAEGPGVRLTGQTVRARSVGKTSGHGRLRLNVAELSAICGWPIGDTSQLPVVRLGSRRLPASAAIPREGRVIGESTWPGKARPLALSLDDGHRALHLVGPTGTGKSSVIIRLVEQDLKAGRSAFVVDPKSDLITDILERIPDQRRDDVVVISAADNDDVVGVNPLAAANDDSPEVAADQLLSIFRQLSIDNWGPRLDEVLSAGLLTLARTGGHSLVSLPTLLTDAAFRRRIVGRLHDPFGLQSFWAQYEAWSEAEKSTAIQPVLRRLRPFLVRPGLRRLVGQPHPGFAFSDIFTKRRIVLVDLARGRVGDEAASLLGAMTLGLFWRAAQGQSTVPPDRRHSVSAYLDEFQRYLALPLDLEDAFATARSLGVSFCIAHQHLKQLNPPSLKAAVLANARSRIAFQLAPEDARELSRDHPQVSADDFLNLDPFHFYAQLVAGNQVQPWCSGRTYPPSKPTSNAAQLRQISAACYGRAAAKIDRDIEVMLGFNKEAGAVGDIGPRRRGGTS